MKLTFEEFLTKYCGKKVDYDKIYGFQCTDVFRQYCQDVLGIPHTGSVAGAKDLYLNYNSLPLEKKYFSALKPTAAVQPGFVAVWGSTPTNKYGHVALVICKPDNTSLIVFEQNGFTQDGAKVVRRSTQNLLGYLKFKGV